MRRPRPEGLIRGRQSLATLHRRARALRRRYATDPRHRPPKGLPAFWTRARRLFWSWWPWSLVSVWTFSIDETGWGIGTLAMALFSYLAAPVETPPRFGLEHAMGVESDEFLTTVAGATGSPFMPGNSLDILNNGDEFFPVMLRDITVAQLSITIEAYIYWAGDVGRRFADVLAERARAGVRVKILLDAVGSADIGSEIVAILEKGGCQIAWYNPIRWYSLGRVNNRTHRKSLIVDGRVAFTGGAGIADNWLGNAEDEHHWRDIQVRIEGPAVTPLQTGFAQNWLESTHELISGPLFYPPQDVAGRLSVLTVLSSPVTGASTARILYYLSIVAARRSILVANPYFVPDPAALDTLIDAKRRGVNVRIMVSGRHNDNWLSRRNAVRMYGPLLAAEIEILEFEPTLLHHKMMVVDGVWTTIGTTNFDSRSFAHNEESNVCVYDRALAAELPQFSRRTPVGAPASRSSDGSSAAWRGGHRKSWPPSSRNRCKRHADACRHGWRIFALLALTLRCFISVSFMAQQRTARHGCARACVERRRVSAPKYRRPRRRHNVAPHAQSRPATIERGCSMACDLPSIRS